MNKIILRYKGGEGSGFYDHPGGIGGPGNPGGSQSVGEVGGSISITSVPPITTYQQISTPDKRASYYAKEIKMEPITVGTEKQIKYADDLRSDFIERLSEPGNDAVIRWAVIKQESRNEPLTDTEKRLLAHDAYNRILLNKINTNDARNIINRFVDVSYKIRVSDIISKYIRIINDKGIGWNYIEGKGWNKL